ncbi:MAG: RsmE family RNA methyltransferase [bacterium]|nr:RsmE family RNA methyltransferase [bacterium]
MMQRYFSLIREDATFALSLEDSYHIRSVMRMHIGDFIEVVSEKKLYIASIVSLDKQVVAKVVSEKSDYNEIGFSVCLAQSLLKEQKMDLVLQKATELGASAFIPLVVDRSIINVKGKEDKKIERWQKIVKEASEQAKRNVVPRVHSVMTVSELCQMDYDIKILCTVNEKSKNLKKILSNLQSGVTMLVVVGPEGGFTVREEEKMIDNGFIPISLGHTVLRAETVALFLMSAIHYHDMG